MQAIILDGQLKSALCAVRSLGKAGVEVVVGAERETGMALHSKYTHAHFVYPSPYTDQVNFIQMIKDKAILCHEKPVIFAFSDATYLSLYTYREDLKDIAILVFPESRSVEIAFDKAATYSLARVSGIPTITTYTPESLEEVRRLAEAIQFPAVIKTRRSVTWHEGVGVFGSASFIHSKEELEKKFTELKSRLGEAPLVQDLIFGEEYGVEMLADTGKIFAQVVHHRIRSLSPTGGASVLKETMSAGNLKNTLLSYAEKLVHELAWSGPVMVEFKVDSDSQEVYLMEINGRFWGSLPLSTASGVDMPKLYFDFVHEQKIPSIMVTGKEGVVTNHFLGDVRHLLKVLFGRDKMRAQVYPSRLQALHGFLKKPKNTKSDVFSWDDPKPALMEFIDILKKSWN